MGLSGGQPLLVINTKIIHQHKKKLSLLYYTDALKKDVPGDLLQTRSTLSFNKTDMNLLVVELAARRQKK